MKTVIIVFVILLPLLGRAQSNGFNNSKKCRFETEGVDAFNGNVKKTSNWFFLNGTEQPELDVQFEQNGDNYFMNMALTPQFYPKNYKGYNQPDLTHPNSLQIKFVNGEIVSYDLDSAQSKVSYNYNTYGDGLTRYYPVYKLSKEQVEQLTTQNITKVRVNYNNGYYADTNTDVHSQRQIRTNAGCMLQPS